MSENNKNQFFSTRICDRCGKPLMCTCMSRMNQDTICVKCLEEEKRHPYYREASDAEYESVVNGEYNYPGLYAGQKYPFGADISK